MANIPEMKRSWTASTFDKDKRAKDAERASKYRRFQEDRNALRKAARIAYIKGVREKNPQLLTLATSLRQQNTAMGGDNRNVESIRQRLLLEEAQRGSNASDIYNAISKANALRQPQNVPAPVAPRPKEKDPNRQVNFNANYYDPNAVFYGEQQPYTSSQSQVLNNSLHQEKKI